MFELSPARFAALFWKFTMPCVTLKSLYSASTVSSLCFELMPSDIRNDISSPNETTHIELNGYKVVRITHEEGEIEFLWTDNEYFFNLFCSSVSPDEAEKIFLGIIPDAELTETVKNGGEINTGKFADDQN